MFPGAHDYDQGVVQQVSTISGFSWQLKPATMAEKNVVENRYTHEQTNNRSESYAFTNFDIGESYHITRMRTETKTSTTCLSLIAEALPPRSSNCYLHPCESPFTFKFVIIVIIIFYHPHFSSNFYPWRLYIVFLWCCFLYNYTIPKRAIINTLTSMLQCQSGTYMVRRQYFWYIYMQCSPQCTMHADKRDNIVQQNCKPICIF